MAASLVSCLVPCLAPCLVPCRVPCLVPCLVICFVLIFILIFFPFALATLPLWFFFLKQADKVIELSEARWTVISWVTCQGHGQWSHQSSAWQFDGFQFLVSGLHWQKKDPCGVFFFVCVGWFFCVFLRTNRFFFHLWLFNTGASSCSKQIVMANNSKHLWNVLLCLIVLPVFLSSLLSFCLFFSFCLYFLHFFCLSFFLSFFPSFFICPSPSLSSYLLLHRIHGCQEIGKRFQALSISGICTGWINFVCRIWEKYWINYCKAHFFIIKHLNV